MSKRIMGKVRVIKIFGYTIRLGIQITKEEE